MSTYSTAPVSRKRRICHDYGCHNIIRPGEQYVRAVVFKGDYYDGPQPWVMHVCVSCWRKYDPDKPLVGREKAKS